MLPTPEQIQEGRARWVASQGIEDHKAARARRFSYEADLIRRTDRAELAEESLRRELRLALDTVDTLSHAAALQARREALQELQELAVDHWGPEPDREALEGAVAGAQVLAPGDPAWIALLLLLSSEGDDRAAGMVSDWTPTARLRYAESQAFTNPDWPELPREPRYRAALLASADDMATLGDIPGAEGAAAVASGEPGDDDAATESPVDDDREGVGDVGGPASNAAVGHLPEFVP